MANDIFTGGPSGSPIDWSTGTWSGDNPPIATDIVEQTGAATIDSGTFTIGGLQLDTNADLSIGSGGILTVSGSANPTFGGAGTTIEVAGHLTVGSDVTSANGTVTVDADGKFVFDGSGSTQSITINPLGEFDLTGSNNDSSIATSAASTLVVSGSHDGGVLNLAAGGTVFMASQYTGTIENLSSTGAIALYLGHALNGTPTGFTLDTTNNTVTFDFSTTSGTVAETLTFASSTPVSTLHIGQDFAGGGFGISVAAPTDTFTGGTTVSPVTFSTTTAWSSGLPTAGSAIVVNGAGTLDTTNAGGLEAVAGLTLASGATLDIPTGAGLYVTDSAETAVGGAGSTINDSGVYVVGVFATSVTGTVNVGDHGEYVLNGAGSSGIINVATGGEILMQGWSNAGTINLNGGQFTFNGSLGGANDTTAVNMSGGGILLDKGGQFNGVISNFASNGQIIVNDAGGGAGGNPTTHTIDTASNSLTFNFSSGDSYTLYFNSSTDLVSNLTVTAAGTAFNVSAVCFVTGTHLRTTRGEVAVEDLAVGDLAVTSSGEARPIRWIGHKNVERPTRDNGPVRVVAGAFGEGLPARDLRLSPGHAVCVDVSGEVFVPVGRLVNGATIVREAVSEVTYWHVELESHDVLLAEGLPCESYLEMGNRAFFGRQYGRLEAIHPDRDPLARYARPFIDGGWVVAIVKDRLAARAEDLGWTATDDLDLHLMVDGRRVEPEIDGDLAHFVFRTDARTAVLVSRVVSPAWTNNLADERQLGVGLRRLEVSDAVRLRRDIPLDHPELDDGFHPVEQTDGEMRRWTDGRAPLPASLWQGCRGLAFLTLTFDAIGGAWIAPEPVAGRRRRAVA